LSDMLQRKKSQSFVKNQLTRLLFLLIKQKNYMKKKLIADLAVS